MLRRPGRRGAAEGGGKRLCVETALRSDPRGASAPHTHHSELRNGGRGGGGGEPGGAGPPQPVTTAGIFRTGLKTVESRLRRGRGGSRAMGLRACASPQPIGRYAARRSMRPKRRGGGHEQGKSCPSSPSPNKTRAGARAAGPGRPARQGQGPGGRRNARGRSGRGARTKGAGSRAPRPAPCARAAASAPRPAALATRARVPRPLPARRVRPALPLSSGDPATRRPRPVPPFSFAADRRSQIADSRHRCPPGRAPSSAAPPPCPRPRARAPSRRSRPPRAPSTWVPGGRAGARHGARGRRASLGKTRWELPGCVLRTWCGLCRSHPGPSCLGLQPPFSPGRRC